ncbi:tyrosine-type recombinase/integrase [Sphaerisporangium album]|nr:site-specific integrase [Sphaerisporangium album]
MATVFKKCDCRNKGRCEHKWTVRYREPGGRAARQREKSFRLKAEAEAFEVKIENEKNQGTYSDPSRAKVTFKTYAETWMADMPHRPSTVDTYTRHLKNHIFPTFGNKPLNTIRTGAVQGWVKALTVKGLAPSTVETIYNIFASIIKGAVKDDRLGKSPCVNIKLPDVHKTGISLLSADQVKALADAVPTRYRALILVAFAAGLRQGEALGLCQSRVLFLERKLRVDQQITLTGSKSDGSKGTRPTLSAPKTKASTRDVPLPQFALEALSAHIRAFPPKDDLLFGTVRGNPMRRDYFNDKVWKPALKKAGLPEDTTFHDLRHSFASTALAEGVPISDVSKWLGHASITETVDTYGHLVPEADNRVRSALDGAFNRSSESDGADLVLTLVQ